MKKVFTRKELIHESVERIRDYLRLARKERELTVRFIHECYGIANVLHEISVISVEDEFFLRKIISREFDRIIGYERK